MEVFGKFTRVLTPEEARDTDAYMINELGIPSLALMEQAATAVADAAMGAKKVLAIAGGGNNGGDALAAARILLTRGIDVAVGVTTREYKGDAEANYRLFKDASVLLADEGAIDAFFAEHADADVIIEGIFGTGLSRAPEGRYAHLINAINAHKAKVIAIDIPSGINGGTGHGEVAVRADETVTFQYPKYGHYVVPGRLFTGKLTVAPIGICRGTEGKAFHVDFAKLPKRAADANKGTYGRLAIIAGQRGMAGAAQLAARGALAAGAGLTQVVSVDYVTDVLQKVLPEAMTRTLGDLERMETLSLEDVAGAKAIAIGPGMGVERKLLRSIGDILETDIPKVIDADGINLLSLDRELLKRAKKAVITPHPREFARISGMDVSDVLKNPVQAAREFGKEYGVDVLLKGATTVVYNHETDETALITSGSPAMAKGGSGDVLTGVIGALMAQGLAPFEAAWAGAYFCGKAGKAAADEKGEYSATAMDTVANLGKFI